SNLPWQAARLLALARCGRRAEASAGAAKLRPRAAGRPELLLQLARCWAVCSAPDGPDQASDRKQALEALEAATEKDYRAPVYLETDPELGLLRGEASYQAALARVKARAAATP